jgi:hypothetical protein
MNCAGSARPIPPIKNLNKSLDKSAQIYTLSYIYDYYYLCIYDKGKGRVWLLMKNFGKYLFKKIRIMLLTLWLIITCTFFLIHSLPGSPYVNQQKLTLTQIEILNRQAGLDRPLIEQYFIYFNNLLHGDFGT